MALFGLMPDRYAPWSGMDSERLHEGEPDGLPETESELIADQYADDLAALHRVSTLAPEDPEERLAQWLDAGNAALGARQGIVLLSMADGLVVRASVGGDAGAVVVGDEVDDLRVDEAILRGVTVAALGGAGSHPGAELGPGSVVVSPLWVSGRLAGAVAFMAAPDHLPFATWTLALIDLVADGVARVLEHQADVRALIRVESQAEAMIALIPDPMVRLDREGREVLDGGASPPGLFDPCEQIRGPGDRPDDATLDRVRLAIAAALDARMLQSAVFATGPDVLAPRVEARFVPAGDHEVLCIVRDITDRHRAEQALAEQVAFEAMVASISTRLIGCSPPELDAAIVAGLGEIAGFFAADTAFIDELSSDGATLHLSHLWTRTGHHGNRQRGERVDLAGFSWLTARFERSGHVFARGPNRLPPKEMASLLVDPEDLGVLWVRLGSGGDLAGVVGLTWRTQEPPASEEVLGLVRFAADAFHGALRRRSVALLAEDQAGVFESIARGEPVATALLAARDLLAHHTLGATVIVVTVGEDHLDLVSDDPENPWGTWFALLPIDLSNPYGQAVVTGEPVMVADARSDPRFGTSGVPDPMFRSVSVLPVRSSRDGRTLAVVALLAEEPSATLPRAAVRDSALSLLTVALERELDARRLAHQATHDPLTGVGNRAALLDRLNVVLARARRSGHPVAVLYCDLDGFKAVNDQFGHDRGDRLLVEVADRIKRAVRPSDTLSRTGGDEFVIVCEDLGSPDQAGVIAARVIEAIEGSPVMLGDLRLDVGVSVGLALADPVLDDPDRVLRNADLAMYEMKERRRQGRRSRPLPGEGPLAGRGTPGAPGPFAADLAAAINDGGLDLHQQPLVGRDGSLAGVEVLLRWAEGRPGELGPERIVAGAAEIGMASTLGRWVRRQALVARSDWDLGGAETARPPVHINVAGAELVATGFVETLLADLRDGAVAPDGLVLEIREADLCRPEARAVLTDLHLLGVPVMVDGVGLGGLPLAELAGLPVRGIKIALPLVSRLEGDPVGIEVVRSLVLLAHGLGWHSMAVGVETERQRSVLFGFGIDAVQGRAVAMPVTADEFGSWLMARSQADRS